MPVSNIGSQLSNLYLLGLLRQKLNTTQGQISSGKKGTMLSDLGGAATSSTLSYRNSKSVLDSYVSNLNVVKTRVSTMDKAMASVASSARDTLAVLRSQLQSGKPLDDITRDDAASNLQSVIGKLNVKLDGRYLLAGSDIENPPFADPAALQTSMSSMVTVLMSGSPTKDSVVSDVTGITGTNLGYSNTGLAADNVSVRADDGRSIDYTVKSNDSGFRDIMRGLALVANLPKPTTDAENAKYWTLVNGAIDLLDRGAKAVDTSQAVLGGTTKQITNLLADHQDMSLTMENYIGSVEDVDIAEASSRLQQLQAQLQISYQVTASLKDLSLVNYL